MIERKFIAQKMKEQHVREYIAMQMSKTGHSAIEIKRTPLGEKIIIYTSRPGLVVGKKGENIKRLTEVLKNKFGMENPQIEIGEIENKYLDVNSIADLIVDTFERFGTKRFKFIGYDMLQKIMGAGALGAEIVISGRGVPGSRAKSWRFLAGYLKKSGDLAESYVISTKSAARLKTGAVGIKVKIMPPGVRLPDKIDFRVIPEGIEIIEEEVKEKPKKERKKTEKKTEDKKEEVKKEKPKREVKKHAEKKIEEPKTENVEEDGNSKEE
jgi:small subunit ribosomal protein S3